MHRSNSGNGFLRFFTTAVVMLAPLSFTFDAQAQALPAPNFVVKKLNFNQNQDTWSYLIQFITGNYVLGIATIDNETIDAQPALGVLNIQANERFLLPVPISTTTGHIVDMEAIANNDRLILRQDSVTRTDVRGNQLWINNEFGPIIDFDFIDGSESLSAIDENPVTGEIAVAARKLLNGNSDICVKRLDPDGNLISDNTYNFGGSEIPWSIALSSDGGLVVAGIVSVSFTQTAFLLKLDSNNQVEWYHTYGSGSFFSVKETADGGFVAVGTKRISSLNTESLVIKVDADGNTVFEYDSAEIGDTHWDAYHVIEMSNGELAISGTRHPDPVSGTEFVFLTVLSSDGQEEFTRHFTSQYARGGRVGDMIENPYGGVTILRKSGYSYAQPLFINTDSSGFPGSLTAP